MRLHLVDIDSSLVEAWRTSFAAHPEVSIAEGDILELANCAIVSPANGLGVMDGGIDRDYAIRFGPEFERRVFTAVSQRTEGHLPLGASVVVGTGDSRIPYVVLAPTMLTPERVFDSNVCYRAMRAALRAAGREEARISDLFCPGLCTGVGMLRPEEAASAMALAYLDWAGAQNL